MPQTEISAVIAEIVTVCGDASGINFAPANVTEQAPTSPFAIVYLSNGEASIKVASAVEHLSEVTIQVGLPLTDMARANEVILPIGQDVILALFQGLIDGDITPLNFDRMRYQYGPFQWGGFQMFGWTIIIEAVNTLEALTTA